MIIGYPSPARVITIGESNDSDDDYYDHDIIISMSYDTIYDIIYRNLTDADYLSRFKLRLGSQAQARRPGPAYVCL